MQTGKPCGQAGPEEYRAQSFGLHCPLACSLGPKWLFAVPHPLSAMFTLQNLRFPLKMETGRVRFSVSVQSGSGGSQGAA